MYKIKHLIFILRMGRRKRRGTVERRERNRSRKEKLKKGDVI